MFSPMKILLSSAAIIVLSVSAVQAAEPSKPALSVPPSAHEMPEQKAAEPVQEARMEEVAPMTMKGSEIKPAPEMPRMAEWGYAGANAPQFWGSLDPAFKACADGKMQSPVNIAAYQPEEMERLKIAYAPMKLNVVNSGKGVGVKVEPGSKFMAEEKIYDLQAFKFQSPSEHYVNGAPYPLEMQLLHTDEEGKIAALSVFFKLGAANPVIQSIWENIPASAGAETMREDVTLDLTGLMPSEGEYYAYEGSLSIPPCTEGVKWYVLKSPVEISLEQLHAMQALYPMNARPVQPLNGRVIKGTQ